MLERLRNEIHFDFIACIFDSKGKTFRHKLYPQYKANRPPMPEDLVTQINPLNECIRAMGIPLIFADKVEADDVIGTLTRLATDQGIAVKISTGDKDIAQLVNSSVMIINTMSNEILDEAGVKTKFGVKPQQIIDYLTLIGDKSDNIPGVEKVGPKTSIKCLK